MSRKFFILSFLLPFLPLLCACNRTPRLESVAVDEAAAYPRQEPGTRPPVLTGFSQLSPEQLDEGWIQLFDGISTYGWKVVAGKDELSVQNHLGKNSLIWNRKRNEAEKSSLEHWGYFENAKTEADGGVRRDGGILFSSERKGIYGTLGTFSFIEELAIRFSTMRSLAEADWRSSTGAASGETKAVWTDGELELSGGPGMIETVQEYGDFVLQLEYYTEAGVNSGVFFRCIPGETLNGYECQIFNNPPAEDYEKFIGTDTGGIFRRCAGRNVGPKDGVWNFLTLAAKGSNIATWVNGIQTVDWIDTRNEDDNPRKGRRLKPGTIQLQGHDPGTNIRFRNIRIAALEDVSK